MLTNLAPMKNKRYWSLQAKAKLRSKMEQAGVSNERLAMLLEDAGYAHLEQQTIITKIARGRFSLAFYLQCLEVMGLEE